MTDFQRFISLTNIYNLLPTSSGLRPQTLTSLFQLLTSNSTLELSYFPLTNAWLTAALSQWEISASDKISWLSNTAEIYETKGSKKGDKEKALELRVFALRTAVQDGNADESKNLTQKALRALFAIPSKFEMDEVLNVKSAREGLSGQYKELVELFENGELEAGLSWVQKNESFLSGECKWRFGAGIFMPSLIKATYVNRGCSFEERPDRTKAPTSRLDFFGRQLFHQRDHLRRHCKGSQARRG